MSGTPKAFAKRKRDGSNTPSPTKVKSARSEEKKKTREDGGTWTDALRCKPKDNITSATLNPVNRVGKVIEAIEEKKGPSWVYSDKTEGGPQVRVKSYGGGGGCHFFGHE